MPLFGSFKPLSLLSALFVSIILTDGMSDSHSISSLYKTKQKIRFTFEKLMRRRNFLSVAGGLKFKATSRAKQSSGNGLDLRLIYYRKKMIKNYSVQMKDEKKYLNFLNLSSTLDLERK